jgi:hypothetical protein
MPVTPAATLGGQSKVNAFLRDLTVISTVGEVLSDEARAVAWVTSSGAHLPPTLPSNGFAESCARGWGGVRLAIS